LRHLGSSSTQTKQFERVLPLPDRMRNHLMVNNVPKKRAHEGQGRADVLKQEDGWREPVAEAKGWLTKKIAESTKLEAKDVEAALAALRTIARAEVKKTGKFVIPQLATLTLKRKPARKAGAKVMFRKM
ncbi:HU family DNA-binding protein, partial [bacterium]|nr:HU family DNA-binding protein [bacterium]